MSHSGGVSTLSPASLILKKSSSSSLPQPQKMFVRPLTCLETKREGRGRGGESEGVSVWDMNINMMSSLLCKENMRNDIIVTSCAILLVCVCVCSLPIPLIQIRHFGKKHYKKKLINCAWRHNHDHCYYQKSKDWFRIDAVQPRHITTRSAIQFNDDAHKNVRIGNFISLHFAIHLYGTSRCDVMWLHCINSKPILKELRPYVCVHYTLKLLTQNIELLYVNSRSLTTNLIK